MSLKEQLANDLKDAMRSGDAAKRNTLRALQAAVKQVEIDTRTTLSEQEVLAVITKQAKQRRDSIEQFQQGNRPDLVEEEQKELSIIEAYLPKQLNDVEITERAQAAIVELGVTDMKGMGKVMGKLSNDLRGLADGKRISQIVRQLLSSADS